MATGRTLAAGIAVGLLFGCAHSTVSINSTNSPSAPGSQFSAGAGSGGASVRADVSPATYLGISLVGYALASLQDGYRRFSAGHFMPDLRSPPALAPDRVVTEQDCTRPAVLSGANLRCR